MSHDRWAGHAGLRGDPAVIRLSASLLDRTDRQCADFAALKARTGLWPRIRERRRHPPLETFPLGLVMRALDAVEFGGRDLRQAAEEAVAANRTPVHPGVAVWVSHACRAYLRAAEWITDELEAEGITLAPERLPRIVQSASAAELRMLTAWGRWYGSTDGTVREFRRLRMSRAGDEHTPSTLALAFVTAAGRRAVGNVYQDVPVEVIDDADAPTRIRIVEVTLLEGVPPRVLLDDSPERVRRAYLERVRPLAQGVVLGGERRAGSDCLECKLRAHCEDLPHAPGLLGAEEAGTHRRTWSVTTGRDYAVCPARAHMRQLHLPAAAPGDDSAVRRGRAVHRWLEAAHRRGRPCSPGDLPDPEAAEPGPLAAELTAEEYRQARPYLLAHLATCPLAGPGRIDQVRPEPVVAAFDPVADVLVIAHPDLLRRVDGRLVYREQKTTTGAPPSGTPEEVFAQVPQLALAVLLIAHGVFGEPEGTVELEVLTPSRAHLTAFDAADPQVLQAARGQITRMAGPWLHDTEFAASPGPWCERCPTAQWCPAPRTPAEDGHGGPIEVDGVLIDPRTGEVLDASGPLTTRAAAVCASLRDPDPDEAPPF